MVRPYPGWDVLNDLGRQYYDETQRGYGIDKDKEARLKSRSGLQIKLVNDIVDGSLGLIKKIACNLLNKTGFEMPNERTVTGRARLSLSGFYQTADVGDLMGYGSIGIIEGIHNFDPNRGSISTFISYTAAGKMYREASKDRTIILIPTRVYDSALRIIKTSKNKREAVKRLCYEEEDLTVKMLPKRAVLLYHLVVGDYVDIDMGLGIKNDSPSTEKWADRYLIDEDAINAEDELNSKEVADKIRDVLKSLTPREEKVLNLRFGIGEKTNMTLENVAKNFEVTRERVRQIEAKALTKLRHPSRYKLLIENI